MPDEEMVMPPHAHRRDDARATPHGGRRRRRARRGPGTRSLRSGGDGFDQRQVLSVQNLRRAGGGADDQHVAQHGGSCRG